VSSHISAKWPYLYRNVIYRTSLRTGVADRIFCILFYKAQICAKLIRFYSYASYHNRLN